MSFAIHLDPPVTLLMEELPLPVRASLRAHLQRIAEVAEYLPPQDPRWAEMAHPDGDGLRTYVAGCCVRLHLLPGRRQVRVEQIGRVRISIAPTSDLSLC